MKITKNELLGRLEYLYNVTGVRFQLSSQLAGNGRGYSVMLNGSHIMTFGHVTAKELDLAITAFCKGFYFKEKITLSDANSNAKTIGRQSPLNLNDVLEREIYSNHAHQSINRI